MENLNKIVEDNNKYKNGDFVPNWAKYKFHYARLFITREPNNITDSQLLIPCIDRLSFNDNRMLINFTIHKDGEIRIAGSKEIIDNSYIRDIYMWN